MIADCIQTNPEMMNHFQHPLRGATKNDTYINQNTGNFVTGEYSDILDSIRFSLDNMLSDRRYIRRNSRESILGSSVSSEDDEEEIKSLLSPNILTLLDDLDACIAKLKDVPSLNESFNETDSAEHEPKFGHQSKGSDSSIITDEKSFFNHTFGRRKSNFVTSVRDRQGSLASVTTTSTLSAMAPLSPKGISSHGHFSHITVNGAQALASQCGWLSKLYVTNPSFLARKTWKRRYFVLAGSILYRFKSDMDMALASESFHISSTCSICVTDAFPGKKFVLQVTDPASNTTLNLQTETSEELSQWLSGFKEAIARARFENETLPSPPESQEFSLSFESRRSSAQTLPISFQRGCDPDGFILQPSRVSRANSQPAVQSFPMVPDQGKKRNGTSSVSLANSPPSGKLSNAARLRNGLPARVGSANGSRRPSLAPLQEQEHDDSDFLKEVLSPFNNNRNSSIMGIFSRAP